MSPTGFAKRLTRARRVDRPKPLRGEVSKKVDAELDGGARGNLVVQMDLTRSRRMLTPDARNWPIIWCLPRSVTTSIDV
jgi:hypothetical protein